MLEMFAGSGITLISFVIGAAVGMAASKKKED